MNHQSELLNKHIRKVNQDAGNFTVNPHKFRQLKPAEISLFSELSLGYGDVEYIRNFTDDIVQVAKRDGVLAGIISHRSTFSDNRIIERFKNKLVFIYTRCIDLETYSLGGMRSSSSQSANDAWHELNDSIELECGILTTSSLCPNYQRDLKFELDRVLRRIEQGEENNDFPPEYEDRYREIFSQTERFIRVMVGYEIDISELSATNDNYLGYLGLLIRRIEHSAIKGKNKFPASYIRERGVMQHPLTNLSLETLVKIWQGSKSDTYIEAVNVKQRAQRNCHKKIYLVRNGKIHCQAIEIIPIDSDEEEGIYITNRDSEREVLKTIRHPLEDMDKLNIFYFESEAEKRMTIEQREAVAVEAEVKAKETYAKEKVREAETTKNKNDTSVKTDVLRFAGQVLATIVAVTTAVVGLIRIFSTRVAPRSLFGLAF